MTWAVLEFLHPAMLGWLAAAMVPWWIHRWWRNRPQQIPWAAMHVLREAIRKQSKRMRLQQGLLLFLRMLVFVLIALASSQPAWRPQGQETLGHGPDHYVLLVDQSFSMGCRTGTPQDRLRLTRFDLARDRVRKLIKTTPAGSLFTVLGWAADKRFSLQRLAMKPSDALLAIDELHLMQQPVALTDGLQMALQAIQLARANLPRETRHQLGIVSDMGRNTWRDTVHSRDIQQLCQQLEKECQIWVHSVDQKSSRRTLDLEPVDDHRLEGTPSFSNVAVTQISTIPSTIQTRRPFSVEVTLRAFGSVSAKEYPVELSIDGQLVGRVLCEITAGKKEIVRFKLNDSVSGNHVLHAVCAAQDDLPMDDERWKTVEVHHQYQVLCLEGSPGAAADVVRALNPQVRQQRGGEGVAPQSIYQVTQISEDRLGEFDLSAYDAILVCNAAGFQSQESRKLYDYVQEGGAVLLFLGDQALPGPYFAEDSPWEKIATRKNGKIELGDGGLPIRIGAPKEVQDIHWNLLEYRHPLLAKFREHPNAGLSQVTVAKYVPFSLSRSAQSENEQTPLEVAIALDNKDPAVALGSLGLGQVGVVALPGSLSSRTSSGIPWSSWVVSPCFLPLVRELLTQVVDNRYQELFNRLVGESLVLPESVMRARPLGAGHWFVKTPKQLRMSVVDESLPDQNRFRLLLPAAQEQGVYSLQWEEKSKTDRWNYAFNLDSCDPVTARGESDLVTIDSTQLPDSLPLRPPHSWKPADKKFSLGSILLAAALVCLLCEQGVAWSMGRRWG